MVAELHANEIDFTMAVQESWGGFEEPVTYEENAAYAQWVQLQWEKLQAKQLKLFPNWDLEMERPHDAISGAFQ